MKKYLSILFSFLAPYLIMAQEVSTEAAEVVNEGSKSEPFSMTAKWTMVAIWTVIIIIFVLRTFRNKPTV